MLSTAQTITAVQIVCSDALCCRDAHCTSCCSLRTLSSDIVATGRSSLHVVELSTTLPLLAPAHAAAKAAKHTSWQWPASAPSMTVVCMQATSHASLAVEAQAIACKLDSLAACHQLNASQEHISLTETASLTGLTLGLNYQPISPSMH